MDTSGQSTTPPRLNVSQAARAAGVARSTINKHIKDGKVSLKRDGAGQPYIELAELERVYGSLDTAALTENVHDGQSRTGETDSLDKLLQQEVTFLRQQLADRDERVRALEEDKADLRTERDRLLGVIEEQATGMKLLTDQRAAPVSGQDTTETPSPAEPIITPPPAAEPDMPAAPATEPHRGLLGRLWHRGSRKA